jgi:hypothetical protein
VLIAANNTLVSVQFPNGFENWADPFGATFRRKLNEKKIQPTLFAGAARFDILRAL